MATATIIGSGEISSGNKLTGLTSASQSPVYLDPENMRKTEYVVYLHTISRRAFMQPNGIYRNVAIPACPKEKRSHCFMQIQHPVQIPHLNPDDVNGVPLLKIENAKRVALGICNPDFAGTDLAIQRKGIDPESSLSSGECNLTRQGVFASMNAVATEEEEKWAEGEREKYYRFRLQEADGLERSNPRQLQHILQLDHHMAADFFGVESNWHRAPSAKVDCPNCGDKISGGGAYHYLPNGRVCVLDWERAWLAGAVKKDDVPEPKRWWSKSKIADTSFDGWSKEQVQEYATSHGIEFDGRWSQEKTVAIVREAAASLIPAA